MGISTRSASVYINERGLFVLLEAELIRERSEVEKRGTEVHSVGEVVHLVDLWRDFGCVRGVVYRNEDDQFELVVEPLLSSDGVDVLEIEVA